MRLREKDIPLDPEVARELEALDRALAGEAVEPDLEDLAALARELRGERPEPPPEFAEKLDSRVASRFPRDLVGARAALARLGEWLASMPPRRMLASAGGAVAAVVVAAVAVAQVGELGGGNGGSAPPPGGGAQPAVAEGEAAGKGGDAPSVQGFSAGSGVRREADLLSEGRAGPLRNRLAPDAERIVPIAPGPPPGGGIRPRQPQRVVERSADLTLGAPNDEVDDVADEVVQVTKAHGGFVVSSQVSSGEERSRASFDLAIPSDQLETVTAELSDLAHVQSLNEGLVDITAPTISAEERLDERTARLESLRDRRAAAKAAGDVDEVRRLRGLIAEARDDVHQARLALRAVERRAQFSRVAVAITSDGEVDEGGWTFDDALGDAGRVLEVTAGIMLVSAAVLLPIALLALVAWLVGRSWLGYRREQALD